MLKLNGADFTIGRSRFTDRLSPNSASTAKVYVKFRPLDLNGVFLAQLDTGAAWSILERDVADAIGAFGERGEKIVIDTRHGRIAGQLVRIALVLLADEGESLQVEATVFVSGEWASGSFVGYGGLLERIRIALDPRENNFYFGR